LCKTRILRRMSALSKQVTFVSVVEYLHDEDLSDVKHEYINGTVHAMAGGTVGHGETGKRIVVALSNHLRGKDCRPHNSDIAVHLAQARDERYYYPDASVTCGPLDRAARALENPVVIFEVLSPTTARIDQTEKKDAYLACQSIQHYVIVDPERVNVIIYTREQSSWKMTAYNELTDALDLTAIEVTLTLAEIYEG
jgi:Uma2 family endonuclease